MMIVYTADLIVQSWYEKKIYDTFVYVLDELADKLMKQNTEKKRTVIKSIKLLQKISLKKITQIKLIISFRIFRTYYLQAVKYHLL